MEMLYVWIIAAVVLAIVEMATVNLVSIWFCFGAVAAALTAVVTDSIAAQITVFLVVSALLLLITKPLVKRLNKKDKVKTNADAIIGQEGIVTVDIDPPQNQGQIRVIGQVWSAKSENDGPIAKDTAVVVTAITGVKAVVKVKEEQ